MTEGSMIIIGLCGNSGSGKGYISAKLAKHGVAFIDTDKVYRQEVLPDPACISELVGCFGDGILEYGQVSKRKLAALVFEGEGASERLKRLNEITHKYIKVKTDKYVSDFEKEGYSAVLIDAPVLFESGFDKMCHVTLCVTAPYEMKIARIIKRDGISREKAQARLKTQMHEAELLKRCTYSVDNTDGCDIDGQIKAILKDLNIG
jgi:dephospho-CoA kinase